MFKLISLYSYILFCNEWKFKLNNARRKVKKIEVNYLAIPFFTSSNRCCLLKNTFWRIITSELEQFSKTISRYCEDFSNASFILSQGYSETKSAIWNIFLLYTLNNPIPANWWCIATLTHNFLNSNQFFPAIRNGTKVQLPFQAHRVSRLSSYISGTGCTIVPTSTDFTLHKFFQLTFNIQY